MRGSSGFKASCFSCVGLIRSPFRRKSNSQASTSKKDIYKVDAHIGHATFLSSEDDDEEQFLVLSPTGGVSSPDDGPEKEFGSGHHGAVLHIRDIL